MTTALAPTSVGEPSEIRALAELLAGAKQFKGDASGAILDVHKAAVRIMVARELGIGVMTSISDVYVIDGKPTLSYKLMADLVERTGRYDYEILEDGDKKCRIEFFALKQSPTGGPARDADGLPIRARSLGVEEFTWEEAVRAELVGKQNWKKYPRSMLFARCYGNGVRKRLRNVASGFPMYLADEFESAKPIDATVVSTVTANKNGATVTIPAATVVQTAPAQTATVESKKPEHDPEPTPKKVEEPGKLADGLEKLVEKPVETKPAPEKPTEPAPAATEPTAEAAPTRKPRKNRFKVIEGGTSTAPAETAPTTPAPDAEAEKRATALAAEVGLKPGDDHPLAPPAESKPAGTTPATTPDTPRDEFEEALNDVEACLAGVDQEADVNKAVAKSAYALGVNHYGSDANACAAWQAVGYEIKKGKPPKRLPKVREVAGYVKTIRDARKTAKPTGAASSAGDEH